MSPQFRRFVRAQEWPALAIGRVSALSVINPTAIKRAARDRGNASHSTDHHLPVAEVSMGRDVKAILCSRKCRTSWLASFLAPKTPTSVGQTAAATTLSFFCLLTGQLAPLLLLGPVLARLYATRYAHARHLGGLLYPLHPTGLHFRRSLPSHSAREG